jgi:hypothetical protein
MERNLLRSWTSCQLESFLYNLTEDTVINAALVDWFQKIYPSAACSRA